MKKRDMARRAESAEKSSEYWSKALSSDPFAGPVRKAMKDMAEYLRAKADGVKSGGQVKRRVS